MIKKQGNIDATYRSLSSWKLSMTSGRAKVSSYWPNLDWIILENTIIKNKVVSNTKKSNAEFFAWYAKKKEKLTNFEMRWTLTLLWLYISANQESIKRFFEGILTIFQKIF